ncbi:MAG: phosphatase PAP2 family protein [Acidimicrobiales bacterium]
MRWITWDQAAAVAVVSGVACLIVRTDRFRGWRESRRWRWAEPTAAELTIVATLYAVWRLARQLPFTRVDGALERGLDIHRFEAWLGLPSELALQHFVERHDWLGPPIADYYAYVHIPATVAGMVWLFARHRDHYPHWRNGLALVTLGCLIIRFVRVAPPRFFPELGFVDLADRYGTSVYGPVGTGVSDQFAAMPSIHVAWAAVVSFGLFAVSTGRRRWLALGHVAITAAIVSATAHHWWLDSVVALVLLAVALAADTTVRRRIATTGRADKAEDLDLTDRAVSTDRPEPTDRPGLTGAGDVGEPGTAAPVHTRTSRETV